MVKVKYLGHSFFKIKYKGVNVIIDPFINGGSENPALKRVLPCPIKEESIKDIGLILVTHEHFDHFDKQTIESIAKRDNSLVVSTQNILNDLDLPHNLLVPVGVGEIKNLKGINITVNPCHHPSAFYPVSFLLEKDNKKILHAGDSALTSCFEGIKPDLALLPIGGGNMTMDVVDAVKATKTMKPDYVIPMHYNTFPLIKVDPREFVSRIEKSILKTKPVVLNPKEEFEF